MITENNKTLTILLAVFFTALYIPFLSTPLYCLLMMAICLLSFIKYPNEDNRTVLPIMIAFFGVEVIYLFFGKGLSWQNTFVNSLSFLTGMLICRCLKYLNNRQINTVFVCLLIALAYTLLWSYYYLLSDPMYVRYFGYSGSEELAQPFYKPVIKYGNGEALSIMLPLVLAYCLNSKNKYVIIATSLIVIGGIGIQIMATLTTSAFLSILFCAFVVLRSVANTSRKARMFSAIFVVCIVTVIALKVFSFDISHQMLMKIEDVNESINEGQATGQVGVRVELYIQSINTFLHNPIFGFGEITEFGNYTENSVGLHSAVFDFLALYGLFTLLLYVAWKNIIVNCFCRLQTEKKRLYSCAIMSLVLLLFLKGPVSISTNFIFSTAVLGLFIMQEQNRNNICNTIGQ